MPARRTAVLLAGFGLVLSIVFVSRWPAAAQNESPGRKLAFLVGVNEYRHAKLDKLEFAERDVAELGEVLGSQGYQVVLLKGADAQIDQIQTKLKELLKKASSHDLILVALAGHGLQPSGSSDAFFCPYDANPTIEEQNGTEPNRVKFPETLLPINGKDGLIARLDESGIGQKLLMVDACRNDANAGRGRGVAASIVSLPEQTWVMLSCSRKERAFETKKLGGGHGVFFYHILEGIRGKAANENGDVTWGRLAEFVSENVAKAVPVIIGGGAEQHPHELKSGVGVIALARITVRPKPMPEPMPKPEPAPETPGTFSGTRAGQTRKDNGLNTTLVWIPPGDFTMGSPKEEKDRSDDENQVQVTLTKGFWLGQHEVTQAEWQRVMLNTPWRGEKYVKEGDDYPATCMSWDDAIRFCEKLTETERDVGRLPERWKYTLPTEAQWEYACRGGTKSRFSFGDDDSELTEYAWFTKNADDAGEKYAHQVGQKKPNPWGLNDMHGNVWEWCRDVYAKELPGGTDPEVFVGGSGRVDRGGSWYDTARSCRSAYRSGFTPDSRDYYLGFRVAAVPSGK
jgi:formylglycine-generating enzyme required for sulfatase activity